MKKSILFSFFFCLTAVFFVAAQDKKTPEERATKRTDKMNEVMGLSADVKGKVYNANLKTFQDMRAVADEIKAKYPDKAARKANKAQIKTDFGPKKKAIQKAHVDALKASGVSEEQWTKWKTYRKAQKEKAKAEKLKNKGKGKGKDKGKPESDEDEEDEEEELDGGN